MFEAIVYNWQILWWNSLLEEGGKIFRFEGTNKKSNLKVILRVHKPEFYWKVRLGYYMHLQNSLIHQHMWSNWIIFSQVATEADLGFADAYINGDISFVDANEGLLNFLLVIKRIQNAWSLIIINSSTIIIWNILICSWL